jgi:hypothetical protein
MKEARNIKVREEIPKILVKNKTVKENRHQGNSKNPYCKTKGVKEDVVSKIRVRYLV